MAKWWAIVSLLIASLPRIQVNGLVVVTRLVVVVGLLVVVVGLGVVETLRVVAVVVCRRVVWAFTQIAIAIRTHAKINVLFEIILF